MIVITGAAGFIGSQIALRWNNTRNEKLTLVDHAETFLTRGYSYGSAKNISATVDAEEFLTGLKDLADVSMIIHMGAISSTAEKNKASLKKWNVDYTKTLWDFCVQRSIPFVYASSAATYGDGGEGFSDSHEKLKYLKPLNLYGQSKQEFDLFAVSEKKAPPHWYGLKFFNVYGPHEDHKARMASSIWHGYQEIMTSSKMTLFRSHNADYADGEQARDFIFIADILNIIDFLVKTKPSSGIYNCGTGNPTTYLELARGLFSELGKLEKINWIDTPEEFRAGYQYETKSVQDKLRSAGYNLPATTLAKGIRKYINYLALK